MEGRLEQELLAGGFVRVAGTDEAGRGPLAGDVFAAAVILPPHFQSGAALPGLNDSKKVSEKRRSALFDQIREQAVAFSIARASVAEIESLNILQAALLAMRRAVEAVSPDFVLVDGNRLPALFCSARAVVGGDGLSPSIAAASILAKVARDRYMAEMALRYPAYGFEKHKGYGTKAHYEAVRTHGLCEIHRPSFFQKRKG